MGSQVVQPSLLEFEVALRQVGHCPCLALVGFRDSLELVCYTARARDMLILAAIILSSPVLIECLTESLPLVARCITNDIKGAVLILCGVQLLESRIHVWEQHIGSVLEIGNVISSLSFINCGSIFWVHSTLTEMPRELAVELMGLDATTGVTGLLKLLCNALDCSSTLPRGLLLFGLFFLYWASDKDSLDGDGCFLDSRSNSLSRVDSGTTSLDNHLDTGRLDLSNTSEKAWHEQLDKKNCDNPLNNQ